MLIKYILVQYSIYKGDFRLSDKNRAVDKYIANKEDLGG